MPDTDTSTQQQACPACGGTTQVQVPIHNSATGTETTLTQTCLDCLP